MLQGLDVSHHNGPVDWIKVKAAGYSFAFCKATQGTTFTDPLFQRNIQQGFQAGLLMGAYHFLEPLQDPALQVQHFLDQVRTCPRPLMVALDVELLDQDPEPWDQLDWQLRAYKVNYFLDTIIEALRAKPFLYFSPSFAEKYLQGVSLGFYPNWLADYVTAPSARWDNRKIWQQSASGDIPGVPSPMDDVDVSPLSIEELTALAVQA